jgi:hypothetical protein
MTRAILLALAIQAIQPAPQSAYPPPSKWLEVSTYRTTVISDAGDREASLLLGRIDQIRNNVAVALGGAARDLDDRLIVAAPRDVGVMRELVGDGARSNRALLVAASLPAPYSHHLAVRAGTRQSRRDEFLMHEYLHRVTQANLGDAPAWLDEGLSEFWSTLKIERDGNRVGGPVSRHVNTLRSQRLIPLAELMKVERGRYDALGGRLGLFYAQSWALVHYLMKMQTTWPVYAPQLPEDMALLQKSFESFVRTGNFESIYWPRPQTTLMPGDIAMGMMSAPESKVLAVLGSMALYGDRPQTGLSFAERALKLSPAEPLALEVKGIYFFLTNQHDHAREWLKRAVEHPSASFRAHYYYAVLNAGTPAVAETHLKRALELKPGFHPAQQRLQGSQKFAPI